MFNLIAGIILGMLFSLIAIITGKKFEQAINNPKHTITPIKNNIIIPQAQIIRKNDDIEEFLNEN